MSSIKKNKGDKFCKTPPIKSANIPEDRTGTHSRITTPYSKPHVHKSLTRAVLSHVSPVSVVSSYEEEVENDKNKQRGRYTYYNW